MKTKRAADHKIGGSFALLSYRNITAPIELILNDTRLGNLSIAAAAPKCERDLKFKLLPAGASSRLDYLTDKT